MILPIVVVESDSKFRNLTEDAVKDCASIGLFFILHFKMLIVKKRIEINLS